MKITLIRFVLSVEKTCYVGETIGDTRETPMIF